MTGSSHTYVLILMVQIAVDVEPAKVGNRGSETGGPNKVRYDPLAGLRGGAEELIRPGLALPRRLIFILMSISRKSTPHLKKLSRPLCSLTMSKTTPEEAMTEDELAGTAKPSASPSRNACTTTYSPPILLP
jgi:hypothetical protein